MINFRPLYTLILREFKRFIRDRMRIVVLVVQPLLWLFIFGAGFGPHLAIPGITYQQFLLPGIIAQTLLFTSMFMGISVIWDREFGFMKEILVAPIPRYTLFLGKMFGDSINAILQGLITFAFGALLGIPFEALAFLACIPIMLLMTFGLTSIGLTLASFIGSLENFGAIQTFVNLPLFFLSGALFPVTQNLGAPLWLSVASAFNPVSYGVDALRTVLLGSAWIPTNPLFVNLGVLAIFDVVMIGVGTWAFSRMK